MKPGDLVRPLPGYTEMRDPHCGIIVERADLIDSQSNLDRYRSASRFIVMFPQGQFPMYNFEMEVIDED
jgi:hypothetical protein